MIELEIQREMEKRISRLKGSVIISDLRTYTSQHRQWENVLFKNLLIQDYEPICTRPSECTTNRLQKGTVGS